MFLCLACSRVSSSSFSRRLHRAALIAARLAPQPVRSVPVPMPTDTTTATAASVTAARFPSPPTTSPLTVLLGAPVVPTPFPSPPTKSPPAVPLGALWFGAGIDGGFICRMYAKSRFLGPFLSLHEAAGDEPPPPPPPLPLLLEGLPSRTFLICRCLTPGVTGAVLGLLPSVPPGADAVVVVGGASFAPDVDPVHCVAVVAVSDAFVVGSAWVCPNNASAWPLFFLRSAFRRNISSLRASTFENTFIMLFVIPKYRLSGGVVSIVRTRYVTV